MSRKNTFAASCNIKTLQSNANAVRSILFTCRTVQTVLTKRSKLTICSNFPCSTFTEAIAAVEGALVFFFDDFIKKNNDLVNQNARPAGVAHELLSTFVYTGL